ncbi:Lem2-Nur1 complex subunit Nur1 [Schizosaccharomyces osmophilus]|uniref:Lem2-Nur1 complex subunit Nur1 n=1 Tax=Schizosaccharomyces osmophilus TaxID=2545709 RepID=A0AAF0AXC9_9SCHI|nr:Lem2-Nur1 complex subunit Nur1 [Schizosaccharomyces osmophilus]WBW74672.1 Lem2-Nur1 complex subunit Nur1 [Schizosaccharomyces osmophilus]
MAKLIRRSSLTSRILNFPINVFISVSEDFDSVEWDKVSERWSIPLSLVSNILFIFIRAYLENTKLRLNRSQLFVGAKSAKATNSWFRGFLSFFSLCLVVFSIINILSCFYFQKKTYRTLPQPDKNVQTTPGLRSAQLEPSENENKCFELIVWSPNRFSLYFSCLFSPIHLFILWVYIQSPKIILLSVIFSLLLFFIARKFVDMMKDKDCLHQQVFYEYDKKFVEPRLSVAKRDVATNTSYGPVSAAVEYYSPRRPIDAFLEHKTSPSVRSPKTPGSPLFTYRRGNRHSLASSVPRETNSPLKRFSRFPAERRQFES